MRLPIPHRYDLARSLGVLGLGRSDPTARVSGREAWWATLTPIGPATLHLERVDDEHLAAAAFGAGADWVLERADAVAGLRDDLTGFTDLARAHPVVYRLAREFSGLRLPRTERVFHAVLPTILGQKVTGLEAKRAMSGIVRHFGAAAPGPVENLYTPPDPQRLASAPYYAYHRFGVEQKRADTIRRAAAVAHRLEEAVDSVTATARLTAIAGIGAWTAAEVTRVAYGDADQVSVGDYHIPHQVSWALAGEARGTDDRMLQLLAPFAGHRGRVCLLLAAAGIGAPRFGHRLPVRSFAKYYWKRAAVTTSTGDKWANWLLHRRLGGDPGRRQAMMDFLGPVRDRVLDEARLAPGDILLDVGTGDGLIAFGALERVGPTGSVILHDISPELLDHCRAFADGAGVLDRCRFELGSAADLSAIADESVDVVTTRSVLIYLPAAGKAAAIREFQRVLRPGGRISLFEPINSFGHPEPPHLFCGYDVTPVAAIAKKLRRASDHSQANGAAAHPLLDFDERDLLGWVEAAGLADITMDYRAEILREAWFADWHAFLHTAGNPLDPTLGEAMASALTPAEAEALTAHLRPLVERKEGIKRFARVFLWATKP